MDWLTDYLEGMPGGGTVPAVQADATATPVPRGLPQPTIGPSSMASARFDALPRASVPSTPQGLAAFWQRIMDPSSKLGRVAGFLPPIAGFQAGKQASDAVDSGHPGLAALTAFGAIGLPPEAGGLLGEAEHEAAPLGLKAVQAAAQAGPKFLGIRPINATDAVAHYALPGAQNDEAFVTHTMQPDGSMRVGFVGSTGGEGSLGAGQLRAILRDLKARTAATAMSGTRISGARPGHEMALGLPSS